MSDVVSIVVPAYNEAASLPELVERVARVADGEGWDWELVCVLDGCCDDSAAVLAALEQPRLRVVELPDNRGQHAALDVGLRRAVGSVVLTMDADLQVLPESLPSLVAALRDGADAVCGWRRERHDTPWRRIVSRAFNLAAARFVGLEGNDLGCMLRGYRRAVLDRYLASGEAPLYLPVQIGRHASRVVELPVSHAPRAHGASHYDTRRLLRLGLAVLRSRFAPPRLKGSALWVIRGSSEARRPPGRGK